VNECKRRCLSLIGEREHVVDSFRFTLFLLKMVRFVNWVGSKYFMFPGLSVQ